MTDTAAGAEGQETGAQQAAADTAARPDDDRLRVGASQFATVVASDPALVSSLNEILRRQLVDNPITAETMANVFFAVGQLLGSDAGYFLTQYLTSDQPGEFLERYELLDRSAVAEREIRRLQAFYGLPAAQAWKQLGQLPTDWANVHREVYVDVLDKSWLIRLVISRFDGTDLTIEARPDSIAQLASNIFRTMNQVDRSAFEREVVESLLAQVTEFFDGFSDDGGEPSDAPTE